MGCLVAATPCCARTSSFSRRWRPTTRGARGTLVMARDCRLDPRRTIPAVYAASYNGSNKKVLFAEFWRHELEDAMARDPVVIVPVGSIEQHGPHCPPDVDISIPYHLAIAA